MAEPFSYRPSRGKLAVIGGMMAYFESIMPASFRAERGDHITAVTLPLAAEFDIVELGLWADTGEIEPMARRLEADACDVLVLIPTMATPPAEIAALAATAGLPVVIVCAHELEQISADYDMAALCRHSINVGATMLGAMLRRQAPPIRPVLVAGFLSDAAFHARVRMAVRTAALAGRMRGLRIGRLGRPMTGYDHLGLSEAEAEASGLAVVDVNYGEWAERFAAVTRAQIAEALAAALPRLLPPQARYAPSPDLERAIRLGLALDRLADDLQLDCGAIACRGPFGDGLQGGAISCLATTLLAATGRPFAATGDMVTAIAMLIGRTLGGAALYCELDAVDRARDAFLVANTGEADIGWCPPGGRFEVVDASAHSGRQVPGVVLSHELDCSPATMLGAALDQGRSERLSLLAMEGRTLEPSVTALKVTNGWFQPSHQPALSAFEAWANAGATHHGALAPGHLSEAVQWLGVLCQLPVTSITENGAKNNG
jgi:L-arabinose isomerase